jgi:hypothetical protein
MGTEEDPEKETDQEPSEGGSEEESSMDIIEDRLDMKIDDESVNDLPTPELLSEGPKHSRP